MNKFHCKDEPYRINHGPIYTIFIFLCRCTFEAAPRTKEMMTEIGSFSNLKRYFFWNKKLSQVLFVFIYLYYAIKYIYIYNILYIFTSKLSHKTKHIQYSTVYISVIRLWRHLLSYKGIKYAIENKNNILFNVITINALLVNPRSIS